MKNIIVILTRIIPIFTVLALSSCNRGIGNDVNAINAEKYTENKNNQTEKGKQGKNNESDQEKQEKTESDDTSKKNRPFIFVWKVNGSGSFGIPVQKELKNEYKFNLKWYRVDNPKIYGEKLDMHARFSDRNDGRHQVAVDGLPGAGEYVIEITGAFPAIRFGNSNNTIANEIIEIKQWGDIEWRTMNKAFYGCINLRMTAEDAPDLSNVTDMSYMFYKASTLNGPVNHWDVSNVNNMLSMFEKAKTFNQNLDKWNVSKVTSMNNMFREALSFDKSINNWDVSSVKDMGGMFYGTMTFDEPLSKWNVSNVTNMSSMFEKAEMFNQSLNDWKVDSKTNLSRMFVGARYFDKKNISSWKVSSKDMH